MKIVKSLTNDFLTISIVLETFSQTQTISILNRHPAPFSNCPAQQTTTQSSHGSRVKFSKLEHL